MQVIYIVCHPNFVEQNQDMRNFSERKLYYFANLETNNWRDQPK